MAIYASHASAEFNARIDGAIRGIASEVRALFGKNLVALVLGGGYGRGEGGVVMAGTREMPYNGFDFTLVVADRSRVDAAALAEIASRYGAMLNIGVDFGTPLCIDDIRTWSHELVWTELLNGHVVVAGNAYVLKDNAPQELRKCPPPVEATRLLLNRGAGLLWALRVRRGLEEAPHEDFVRSSAMKCGLAMGDALAIAHGRHRTAYEGRSAIFAELENDIAEVADLGVGTFYNHALAFRLAPGDPRPDAFGERELAAIAESWAAVLLHVESVRTGTRFDSIAEYSDRGDMREPEKNAPAHWPRNLVQNLRSGRLSVRYPRERLFRDLPPLLAATGPAGRSWNRASRSALELWQRFS